jgi:hypothetical protein
MSTSDSFPEFDRTGMQVVCSDCDFSQEITLKGEEDEIEARHAEQTGHRGLFGYTWGENQEAHDRSEWEEAIAAEEPRKGTRFPGFQSTCSKCRSARPCVPWNGKPICFNCALLYSVPVRRRFGDNTNRRVQLTAGYDVPAWEVDDIVDESDLPRGRYFYHYTEMKKLKVIRENGLVSNKDFLRNTIQQRTTIIPGETRLFLFPDSEDALSYIHEWNKDLPGYVPNVVLRFKRTHLKKSRKFWDDGYNAGIFAIFVREASVPAAEMEVCYSTKWVEGRGRHAARGWTDLVTKQAPANPSVS